MTQPVEDVEKLAERVWIALLTKARESDALMHEFDDGMAQGLIAAEMRTNFAARDAEVQRLREAAESYMKAHDALNKASEYPMDASERAAYVHAFVGSHEQLRAALHTNHQEPSE